MAEKRQLSKSLASQTPARPYKATRTAPSDLPVSHTQAFPSHGRPGGIRRRIPVIRKYVSQRPLAGASRSGAPPPSKDPVRPKVPIRPGVPLALSKKPKSSNTEITPGSDNALKAKIIGQLQKDPSITKGSAKAGLLPKTDVGKENRREGTLIRGNGSRPTLETVIAVGDHQNRPRGGIKRELSTTVGGIDTNLQAKERMGIATSQANVEGIEDLREQIQILLQDREDLKAEVAALKLRISHLEGPFGSNLDSPLFVGQSPVGEIHGRAPSPTPDGLKNTDGSLYQVAENEPFGAQTPFEGVDNTAPSSVSQGPPSLLDESSDELSSMAFSAVVESPPATQESEDEVDENLKAGLEEGLATMEKLYDDEEPPYETNQREDLNFLAPKIGREPRSARLSAQSPRDYCMDSTISR